MKTHLTFIILISLCSILNLHCVQSFGDEELSSLVDADLFLEDEGSGGGRVDDLEPSGSGIGPDDEDNIRQPPPKAQPPGPLPTIGGVPQPGATAPVPPTKILNEIFDKKQESSASGSFFSQPGILAAIICGAIVGLLCAILLVMFIVYRMRKKDEGSYVLEDSKRTSSYGKSKEFFA
jgi:syndecan 2